MPELTVIVSVLTRGNPGRKIRLCGQCEGSHACANCFCVCFNQREPRQQELDSAGAALLDGFPRMYLWIGARCDNVSRVKVGLSVYLSVCLSAC